MINIQMVNFKSSLRNIFSTLIFSLFLVQVPAQSLIEKAFVSMPNEYYLSLSKDMRKDMLLNYLMDTSSVKKNLFKGESSIEILDPAKDFIRIKNSNQGTLELKLLRANDSIIYIALNFTACAPVCDSHLSFYAANWQLLKQSLLKTPTTTDYLDLDIIKNEGLNPNEVALLFDFALIENHFIDNGNHVEMLLNCEKNMDPDNYSRLKKYLKGNKILYTWKNGLYEKTSCYW